MKAKIITIIILAGLAAIFIFQNAAMVDLKFLFWTLPASMTPTMFLIFFIRKNIRLVAARNFQ